MTPDEILDDYCREMEWPIPPEGSKRRKIIMRGVIEAALADKPSIASGAELIDWMFGEEP
ncbi:MAG: hypothetical protein KGJ13_12400 [Patescibacteria group bacterium]|nr:hypothetical protein [Patescibacteria group bacterium]